MARGSRHLLGQLSLILTVILGMAAQATSAFADATTSCDRDCFVLNSVSIEGVSAYPMAALASVYADRLASPVGEQDLVRMADAITEHYRRDGYFLTRAVVAPGDPAAGAARIVVYEGYIGEVVVEGTGAAAVSGILLPLEHTSILTVAELDRRLALASDVPGVTLTNRIEPILDDPARHRLVVTAELDRSAGGVFVENRGSEAQGPWQVYGWVAGNSVLRDGDRVAASVLTTPQDVEELTYAEASYSVPLGSHTRFKVSITGYSTNAPPGASAWLSGDSRAASLSLTQTLVRRKDRGLYVTASLDVREVEQTYMGGRTVDEKLAVARALVSGQVTGARGWISGWAGVSRGLDAFGATTEARPGQTRADATGEFTKIAIGGSAYHDISRHVGVYASATAQSSDDPLLGSEEFYIGGSEVGRAFAYGERNGDKGIAGVVELRVGWDPSPSQVRFVQVYGFLDGGRIWNASPGGDVTAEIASAGVGTRITLQGQTMVRAELARPISGRALDDRDGGWRAFVSLSQSF